MSDDLTQKLPKSDSDKRLYDTRPIWEKVVADIAQLLEGQGRLEEGQKLLHAGVREIRTLQRDASRRMSLFNDTLTAIQVDYRDIYDRLRGLELNQDRQNSST